MTKFPRTIREALGPHARFDPSPEPVAIPLAIVCGIGVALALGALLATVFP